LPASVRAVPGVCPPKYGVPDIVRDQNVEAAVAANIANEILTTTPNASPDYREHVHLQAFAVVSTVRRLGDAGLLDGQIVDFGKRVAFSRTDLGLAVEGLAGVNENPGKLVAEELLSKLLPES
jgi:hypothetical protein